MSGALAFRSLLDISAMLAARAVSAEEITALMLQRIERYNPRFYGFIRVFDEEARRRARQLDRELAAGRRRGSLHGVPIAIKDIFDFAGHRASGGSRIERSGDLGHATVVHKLEAAGAIILGTLNLDELAAGGSGDNAHFGRCRNPWNPAHSSGGSSSGSACAVAAGLCYAALGSDAGGSIRIPAAFCGVAGLKPSYGRVSRHGALARTWSMDCIGPLARDSSDLGVVFNAILGHDPHDASTVESRPVSWAKAAPRRARPARIALLDDDASRRHGAADAHYRGAIRLFAEAGYALHKRSIPDLERYTQMQQIVVKSEGAAMHRRALLDPASGMSHAVRSVIEGGLDIAAVSYIEALSLRSGLLQDFVERVLGDCDLLLLPVSLPGAPVFTPADTLQGAEIDRAFSQTATMTRFANYLGLPAISLPSGLAQNGLPSAIQLVARPFEESLLLSSAVHFEALRGASACPALD